MTSGPKNISDGARVLLVDDEPRDRELLRVVLEEDGYTVVECENGKSALQLIAEDPPDVILLDVMLPDANGVELCRQLSEAPTTMAIPVLLVTSQTEREDRIEGISAGALDHIAKPVDLADLRVRVRNAAQVKRLFDQSEGRYHRIRELEFLRDSLVHMVVHDLKSPLTMIRGNLDLLGMIVGGSLVPDDRRIFEACVDGAEQMTRMVNSLLDLNKIESGAMKLVLREVRILDVLQEARSSLGKVGANRLVVSANPFEGDDAVECDRSLVKRVAVNLFANALSYTPRPGRVAVTVTPEPHSVRFEVKDGGPGIPEEFRDKIFEKFFQLDHTREVRKDSTGLGLAFCKLAVESHGGTIGVTDAPESGSVFWVDLPRVPNPPVSGS